MEDYPSTNGFNRNTALNGGANFQNSGVGNSDSSGSFLKRNYTKIMISLILLIGIVLIALIIFYVLFDGEREKSEEKDLDTTEPEEYPVLPEGALDPSEESETPTSEEEGVLDSEDGDNPAGYGGSPELPEGAVIIVEDDEEDVLDPEDGDNPAGSEEDNTPLPDGALDPSQEPEEEEDVLDPEDGLNPAG
jgi:hypothetical protein